MPQPASFKIEVVKAVFSEHGLYVLNEFDDGQINWGTEPLTTPYSGIFHFADFFVPGRYDIFTVRAILSKLEKSGERTAIEAALFKSLAEEEFEYEIDPDTQAN